MRSWNYFSTAAKKRLKLTFSYSCSSVWRNRYRHWSDQSNFHAPAIFEVSHIYVKCVCTNCCCIIQQQAFCWEHNWIEFPCLRFYLVWVHMRVRMSARVLIHIWADTQGAVSCLTMRWLRTLEISVPKERGAVINIFGIKDVSDWRSTSPKMSDFLYFFKNLRLKVGARHNSRCFWRG